MRIMVDPRLSLLCVSTREICDRLLTRVSVGWFWVLMGVAMEQELGGVIGLL